MILASRGDSRRLAETQMSDFLQISWFSYIFLIFFDVLVFSWFFMKNWDFGIPRRLAETQFLDFLEIAGFKKSETSSFSVPRRLAETSFSLIFSKIMEHLRKSIKSMNLGSQPWEAASQIHWFYRFSWFSLIFLIFEKISKNRSPQVSAGLKNSKFLIF